VPDEQMMILVESPWPWLFFGIVVEAALAVALLRTQRGYLLWAMLGVGLVAALGLLVERLVVTEREEVEMTLDAGVAAARANDLNRLLSCISPKAAKTRDYARWVMGRVQIEDVHIHGLEITVNRLTSPPSAKARFSAVGKGRDRLNEFPYQAFAQQVTVELRREGGRWLAADFEVEDFQPSRP
jgi:hypothetical protein